MLYQFLLILLIIMDIINTTFWLLWFEIDLFSTYGELNTAKSSNSNWCVTIWPFFPSQYSEIIINCEKTLIRPSIYRLMSLAVCLSNIWWGDPPLLEPKLTLPLSESQTAVTLNQSTILPHPSRQRAWSHRPLYEMPRLANLAWSAD